MTLVRDDYTIHKADNSATAGNITWTELPIDIKNLFVSIEQSGTAGAAIVLGSSTDSGRLANAVGTGQRIVKIENTATFHAVAVGAYPRYMGFITSGTATCEITARAYFEVDK